MNERPEDEEGEALREIESVERESRSAAVNDDGWSGDEAAGAAAEVDLAARLLSWARQ
jgi:hypothetical protein